MSDFLPVIWVVVGIAIFIVLNVKFKVHNLIALLLVGIFVAFAEGMDPSKIVNTIQNGVGGVFGQLAIIVIFGAIIAKYLSISGASQQIAETITRKCGTKFLSFGLIFIGIIFGMAMFYEVAFLMAVPLVLSIAKKAKIPYMYLVIPIVAGATMGHSIFPPQPGPVALIGAFNTDIPSVYAFGLIVIIPSTICAGVILPKFLPSLKKLKVNSVLAATEELPKDQLPSFVVSIMVPLIPMIFMVGSAIVENLVLEHTVFVTIVSFLGTAVISMLVALCFAVYLLGIRRGQSINEVSKTVGEGIKDISEMVIIICAGGILKQVIIDTGVADNIVNLVSAVPISPFIIGWLITVIIRILTGQGAVAAITAAGIVAPIVTQFNLNPALMAVSCACGSNTITLMYDPSFLLFQRTFGITMKDTFKTWGLLELVNSVVGLAVVMLISFFV